MDKFKGIDLGPLIDAFFALKTPEECAQFLDDLCTVQELRALTQRFQVAQMLSQGKVYNEIVAETGASTATISRVNRALNYGSEGYRIVIDRLEDGGKQ